MMMKSLVVLCLLVVASAVTNRGLSEIGSTIAGRLTVTATYPDTSAAPILATLTYPVTYDSSVTSLSTFSVTSTGGFYFGDNVPYGGSLTFTNGGDVVVVPLAVIPGGGRTFTIVSNALLKFLNSGVYSASLTLQTATYGVYTVAPTTALLSLTATPYVPLSISAFSLVNGQSAGCGATDCTGSLNGTATLSPVLASTGLNVFLRSTTNAATGVLFTTGAGANAGAIDFNTGSASLVATFAGQSTSSGQTVLPSGSFAISAAIYQGSARITPVSEATLGALQASVSIQTGATADTTAPVCTAAAIAPITQNSNNITVTSVLSLTCTDAGSGLWAKGAFASVTLTSGQANTFVVPIDLGSAATGDIDVQPFVAGELNIIGIYAVDNSGNAVLYGSCGGISGYDSLCGAGSSSASSVAVSIFALALLAFSALFA